MHVCDRIIGQVIASVRLLSVFWVQNRTKRSNRSERCPLFPCVSLHGFVPRVGRNCAHNPKVVSSNLTPATISKSCFRMVLRNKRRANWCLRFIAQFAQRVSPTSSSILNSHLLVLCPRFVPPCPRTDQRISSVGAIFLFACNPTTIADWTQPDFRLSQADFTGLMPDS